MAATETIRPGEPGKPLPVVFEVLSAPGALAVEAGLSERELDHLCGCDQWQ
jgi:hypothetical protein